MITYTSKWNMRDHARRLKVFLYLYMVKVEILSRLLLSVQAFAFRGRLMSLLELTLCGVSSRPFIPQESHACTPSNKCKSRKTAYQREMLTFNYYRKIIQVKSKIHNFRFSHLPKRVVKLYRD